MQYLVTGGAGFIGSHLVEALLAAGAGVSVLDDLSTGKRENLPQGASLREGCITDEAAVAVAMQGCDGVFHLAAIASVTQTMQHWAATHRINQSGAVQVFEQAAKASIPAVYASSAAVYGDNPNLPLAESAVTEPLSPYGLDKLACEWQAAIGHRALGLDSIGMRFFNVYGPRQDPHSPYSGVISIFAERLRQGESLKVFGDGKQTRDFVYVKDVVRGLHAAMQQLHAQPKRCEVFNLCSGRSITLHQLADALGVASGCDVVLEHVAARAGDIAHSCGDAAQFAHALGVPASTPLEVGLRSLWESL